MELPQRDRSLIDDVLEALHDSGHNGMGKAMELLINTAMLLEREQHLRAEPYQRTDERQGYANGFKAKTLKSRLGELNLNVPQTRDGFYPSSIEKGIRSERALKVALAEMYIQGVSTRKVASITEKLCGFSVTSTQVSRASQELDEHFSAWRNRPLGQFKYLWVDARYEKVREGNQVIDCAVLVAKGVGVDGHREILGVSVKLSEAEVHWRDFLQSLVNRGLSGIEMIVSDDHAGLRAARRSIFPSIPWQRCQFHLQQNAQGYVNSKKQRGEVGESIRCIFNASNATEAQRLLRLTVDEYAKSNPSLSVWMENNIPEGFAVFTLPSNHRKKLRTTNPLERQNREIKRRTRVVTIFPNVAACLRLVTGVLIEMSEEWMSGNQFMDMSLNE